MADGGTGGGERGESTGEGGGDVFVEPVQHVVGWHRQAQPGQRQRRLGRLRGAGKNRVHRRAAGDGVGERADRVQAGGERQDAGDRHPAGGGLIADNAAHGGGHPAGAASIGAEPGIGHAIGNRDGGAGGGAAGDAAGGAVPGRTGGAVMRVDAEAGEGKFRHVGAAHHHEAGIHRALHGGGVGGGGRGVGQHFGAGGGGLAGDVGEVFDAEGNAGKRAGGAADGAQPVHRIGGGAGALGIDFQEGATALPRWIGDAGEAILDQLAGGGLAGGKGGGEGGECLHGASLP